MSQPDYKVADIALAAWGRKEINIAVIRACRVLAKVVLDARDSRWNARRLCSQGWPVTIRVCT